MGPRGRARCRDQLAPSRRPDDRSRDGRRLVTPAVVYAEAYGALAGAALAGTCEVRATPTSDALARMPVTVAEIGGMGARSIRAALRTESLAAGDYVVLCTVGLDNQPVELTRTIRIAR